MPADSVRPVTPTAPVAQTFPAVTVDRFGQSFFLTAIDRPPQIVAAGMRKSEIWATFAVVAGAALSVPLLQTPHCEATNVKLCGLYRLSARRVKISIAPAKPDDRCLYGGKDCRL
jgi:hypothetical protein